MRSAIEYTEYRCRPPPCSNFFDSAPQAAHGKASPSAGCRVEVFLGSDRILRYNIAKILSQKYRNGNS
jgi:hypothetical protein